MKIRDWLARLLPATDECPCCVHEDECDLSAEIENYLEQHPADEDVAVGY